MRALATICFVLLFAATSRAQHQEPSLVDRLLRPNMELQNSAQGKRFTTNSAAVERRGTVGTFYLQPSRSEKSFSDTRVYSSTEYSTRSFNASSRAIVSTKSQITNTSAALGTSTVPDVRTAPDAQRNVSTRDYADQRQFIERGKSQKSLDRRNPTLTIDQVRELLNKNK